MAALSRSGADRPDRARCRVGAPMSRARQALALRWAAFGIAALAAGCCTPYGWNSLLASRKILALGSALPLILEWEPANFGSLGALRNLPAARASGLRCCAASGCRRCASCCCWDCCTWRWPGAGRRNPGAARAAGARRAAGAADRRRRGVCIPMRRRPLRGVLFVSVADRAGGGNAWPMRRCIASSRTSTARRSRQWPN